MASDEKRPETALQIHSQDDCRRVHTCSADNIPETRNGIWGLRFSRRFVRRFVTSLLIDLVILVIREGIETII